MDIVVIGTGYFAIECARGVLDSNARLAALISMPAATLPSNSSDIKSFAESKGVLYYEFEDLNTQEAVSTLRRLAPDYILSSWPKILGIEVLKTPTRCVIGSHPTDLPFNRGRHPLHWLIVQGIRQTKLSFFRMDEGIDTGDLLLQVPVDIGDNDSIAKLTDKINAAAYQGVLKLLAKDKGYQGHVQDHSRTNYWRKRTPYDVTLDFRMSADQIIRMVRSYSFPYPCANLIFENKVLKISSARIMPGILQAQELQRLEPGKIISIKGDQLTVKAADEAVELKMVGPLPDRMNVAKYIHPPMKYFKDYFNELFSQLVR